MHVDLKGLGLADKWPRLHALQGEIEDLERRLHKARAAVNLAENRLPAARERDILAEAKAVRSGKKMPEPEEEPRVEAEREEAERMAQRLAVALQAAREEYGEHLFAAQSELYQDIRDARDDVAREAAQAAQVTQRAYSRWADLAYQLKSLTPAEPIHEGAPAQRLTQAFVGIATTRQAGPDRGTVEQVLGYIASLAPAEAPDVDEASDDAA